MLFRYYASVIYAIFANKCSIYVNFVLYSWIKIDFFCYSPPSKTTKLLQNGIIVQSSYQIWSHSSNKIRKSQNEYLDSNFEFNANFLTFLGLYHLLLDTGASSIIIWWLIFEKKPLQFWREIWIQVVVEASTSCSWLVSSTLLKNGLKQFELRYHTYYSWFFFRFFFWENWRC